mgnify:CR=1 FL=1|jgi:hypothetical protein|tara:strand:+ start:691 stop:948 length:258 start_codon:yes stop_codon:yes gene_type:complete
MIQNTDYEMIPNDVDGWDIRILTGEFNETVFTFEHLRVIDDGLKYRISIVESPIEDLNPDENIGLQKAAGAILYNVLDDYCKESK